MCKVGFSLYCGETAWNISCTDNTYNLIYIAFRFKVKAAYVLQPARPRAGLKVTTTGGGYKPCALLSVASTSLKVSGSDVCSLHSGTVPAGHCLWLRSSHMQFEWMPASLFRKENCGCGAKMFTWCLVWLGLGLDMFYITRCSCISSLLQPPSGLPIWLDANDAICCLVFKYCTIDFAGQLPKGESRSHTRKKIVTIWPDFKQIE